MKNPYRIAAAAAAAVCISLQMATGAYAATIVAGSGAVQSGPGEAAQETAQTGGTAWTRVNGQYVDASGNPMSGVVARGVSVSKWQGTIDWAKAAANDIRFAMIRMVSYGYEGQITPDETFDQNVRGAVAQGLYAAPYVYLQTRTTDEARAAAQYAVDQSAAYSLPAGTLIAADVESQYILDLSVQELTDVVNAFCQVVAQNGYTPIVYSDYSKLTGEMDVSQIPYDIWFARYGGDGQFTNRTIWQPTDQASVDGISGKVCLEFAYKDYFSGQAAGPGVSGVTGPAAAGPGVSGVTGPAAAGPGAASQPGVSSAPGQSGGSGAASGQETGSSPVITAN